MKSIGVSNFLPEHIDRLIAETGVSPVVNQIELHPYFSQPKQRQYDQEHQIITWAWSPIGRASSLLQDPVIKGIAAEVHRSPSQVILTLGNSITSAADSQIESFSTSSGKSPAQMQTITNLDRPNGRLQNQDPAVYEEF